MKTTLIIATVVAASFLTSCKKDYSCICSAFGFSGEAELIEDSTKKDAEERCEEIETAAKQAVASTTCSIEKK